VIKFKKIEPTPAMPSYQTSLWFANNLRSIARFADIQERRMLSLTDLPQEILDSYERSKVRAHELLSEFPGLIEVRLAPNTDLFSAYPDSVIWIRSGVFKSFYARKLLRFYGKEDIVVVTMAQSAHCVLSEFSTQIAAIPSDAFTRFICADPSRMTTWLLYYAEVNLVMQSLCASYINEDFKPSINIREFEPGAVIIREGEQPSDLFEMLEGSALVTAGTTELGEVRQGEIFGEISFLTGQLRSATVTAKKRCLVQAINGSEFEKIARYRPALAYRLSQTLAKRLTEVNERLRKACSIT